MSHIAPERFRILTGRFRSLPDFLIIGAQKGGTTTLYRLLEKHPCVIPAIKKEVHYFDNKSLHMRDGLNWYRSHFPITLEKQYKRRISQGNVITGEASPYYLFHPRVPERVFNVVPHVKLIVLLRDPVSRAYSHYHHSVRKGYETLTFEQAIEQEQERLAGEREKLCDDGDYVSSKHANYSYASRGLYRDQLVNWHRFFPKEQLLIIRSESLFSNPAELYSEVLKFLNLPEWNPDTYSKHNGNDRYPDINPNIKKQLTKYFRPHNERLYEYLGMDFSWSL